jgi:N-acylneuraminate cytidylyltransferase
MYKGQSILAVIPARGGSKGLPGKNVRDLGGKPLIAWTIEAAKRSAHIDRVILSSDDAEIIAVATSWGCDVPFTRPDALATDDAPGTAPLIHAVTEVAGYDYVVLLQPTSPLRTADDIDRCIELCLDRGVSSAVSVAAVDKHPAWMFEIDDGRMRPLLTGPIPARRQDLAPVYTLNGAVYVVAIPQLLATGAILQSDTLAYEMPKWRSTDIDTEFDLRLAELILRR